MKKIIFSLTLMLSVLFVFISNSTSACANSEGDKPFTAGTCKFDEKVNVYRIGDSPIWWVTGGINSVNSVDCDSIDDCYLLENWLKSNNYILLSTDDKDITDEDLSYFLSNVACLFADYANRNNDLYWSQKMGKLYVYKPLYDKAIQQLKENDEVTDQTLMEIGSSTVAVDYVVYYFESRVGTVVNEYNDRIPSWYGNLTGFLEITSPIDVEIMFEYPYYHTYDIICVRADTPTLLRMKQGGYVIVGINAIGIDYNEESLNYTNHIVISSENTEEEPYRLNITQTVRKYNIPPIDLSDKPDYDWNSREDFTLDMPTESVVVPSVPDNVSDGKTTLSPAFIILIISVIVLVLTWFLYKKSKKI